MKQLIKPQKLAKILVAFREKNKVDGVRMSQRLLAQKIGVAEYTLQRWEYSLVWISPMMFRRLAQLGIISG